MPALHRLLLPSAARLLPLVALALPIHAASLSYREFLVAPLSLTVSVGSTDAASGDVTLNGNDTQRPTTPFSVVWGDGQTTTGFFPLRHTYADRLRNYAPRVTATYADRSTASVEVIVRFTTVQLSAYAVPAEVAVSLPAVLPALSSTVAGYAIPAGLAPFGSGVFAVHRREVFERVLGAFAVIERDLVNDNLHRTDGTFRQLALALPANHPSYAFSVWHARPVLFVAREAAFAGVPDWSSFAHEMGHNFTLNSPAAYRLGDDLAAEIAARARGSFALLRQRQATAPFASWNDPATPDDETLPTFFAVAWQFFAHQDPDGADYRAATQRLMSRLQLWNPDWERRYSRAANSPVAETFRATLMAAAVASGVRKDLRAAFRAGGFPIDDNIFTAIYNGQADFTHVITSAAGATATVGQPFTYRITATGTPTAFAAAGLPAGLALNASTGEISGTPQIAGPATVRIRASSTAGAGKIDLRLDVAAAPSRLANLSVRSSAGSGDRTLAVGFVVGGGGAPKSVLVRAVGPALTQFGVAGALADPRLTLFDSAARPVQDNDDWGGGGALANAFNAVGAFALPAVSKDAALLANLTAGAYSAEVAVAAGTGVVLVEAYDADATPGPARIVNVSARTVAGTGDDTLAVGFVISGTAPKTILLRAIGPTLAQFGVGGVLLDPQLKLFDRGGRVVRENTGWAGAPALVSAFAQVGAFALPASSKDSALLVTLEPGLYSAQVTGADATAGVVLVEVYEVP